MFKIAVVIFRECLEISLLLSIITAVTKRIENSRVYIIAGAMTGVIASSLLAFAASSISVSFGGMGDELFDSGVILFTVCIISWTVVWMQGYGSKIKQDFENLSDKITSGKLSKLMLLLVVATTVLREGTEIILFIYSISSVENIATEQYLIGIGIGAASGLILGLVIYWGLVKYINKYIFKVSSAMLLLIAAGLAAEAAGILTSSGFITILSEEIWDSSWIVDDRSIIGKLLHVIIGYNSRPNIMQLIFYFGTIFTVWSLAQFRILLLNKNKSS